MLFTGVSSGENLVNFINNASSSVKTVLSKPGCFKRNTNHRKFLQKQLRQTVQQQAPIQMPTKKSNNNNNNNKSPLTVLEKNDSPASKIEKEVNGSSCGENDNNNSNKCSKPTITRTVKHLRTIRKKRRFNPISTTLPTLKTTTTLAKTPSNCPPSIIIPSPTAEYPTLDRLEYDSNSFLSSTDYQAIKKRNFSDRLPSPEYLTATNYYPTTNVSPTLYPTAHFRWSNSTSYNTSSYGTSEEDFGFGDFLSGEDLMKTLEFGDLFIPDYTNELQNNEFIYRSFVENERSLKYLAQLEAIETTYYAQENDLLNNFLSNSF